MLLDARQEGIAGGGDAGVFGIRQLWVGLDDEGGFPCQINLLMRERCTKHNPLP